METALIVEDEERIRVIVQGYCDLARDGGEALELLRDHDYDAILRDIFIPDLDML